MKLTDDYKRYINSPQWKAKREYIISKRGRRCEACGSRAQLKCHHGTYDRLGREKDSDLFSLCQTCHVDLHRKHRVAGRPDLYTFTIRYIASKRR